MYDRNFKLGTTSFIVPDHIVPNVKKLGPYFDEIEILVFESLPKEVLPTKKEIAELLELSKNYDLTYNIHLPTDVSLCSENHDDQARAREILLEVIDLCRPLPVSTHTLHLEVPKTLKGGLNDKQAIMAWKDSFKATLRGFLSGLDNPGTISVETLDYPFSLIEDLVEEFGLHVCLDMGHCIKYDYDWQQTVLRFEDRLPLVHLHGVDFSGAAVKDHKGLDCLPDSHFEQVLSFLKNYQGVVSLEVFNSDNLRCSLKVLSKHFKHIPVLD